MRNGIRLAGLIAAMLVSGADADSAAPLASHRAGYDIPQPDDASTLRADEDPLENTAALEQAWAPVEPEES